MAHYHYSHRDYNYSGELVRDIYREAPRHSQYPTQYIVNNGTLMINDKSLRNTNSIIYNSYGSTIWVEPSSHSRHSHHAHHSHRPHYYSLSAPSNLHTCRGCHHRRELSGGYCHDCINARLRPRIVEVIRDDRRLVGAPERRMIEYR